MNKGVEGPLPGTLSGVPGARETGDSADSSAERVIRRRRRHHRRHQNLTHRSGRAKEIVFVTLLALAILFGILYYLLPHYQAHGEESDSGRQSAGPAIVLTC